MAVKLENPQLAGNLFEGWQEAIIWSCLQNVMGAVYTDQPKNPKSAIAILGDFCFFAGQPDEKLILYQREYLKQDFIIMIPQNENWTHLIMECYKGKVNAITRYAIKKEGDIFDRKRLLAAVRSLKPGFTMNLIDKECYELCKSKAWSQDLVSQFKDYEMFEKLGIGVAIFKNGQLVSGASTYARYENGIEIEIDTKKGYRRMGLAYACGARLILECLERGLYPSWDAQNPGSVKLAEKLGYHFDHEYPAFEIGGYSYLPLTNEGKQPGMDENNAPMPEAGSFWDKTDT